MSIDLILKRAIFVDEELRSLGGNNTHTVSSSSPATTSAGVSSVTATASFLRNILEAACGVELYAAKRHEPAASGSAPKHESSSVAQLFQANARTATSSSVSANQKTGATSAYLDRSAILTIASREGVSAAKTLLISAEGQQLLQVLETLVIECRGGSSGTARQSPSASATRKSYATATATSSSSEIQHTPQRSGSASKNSRRASGSSMPPMSAANRPLSASADRTALKASGFTAPSVLDLSPLVSDEAIRKVIADEVAKTVSSPSSEPNTPEKNSHSSKAGNTSEAPTSVALSGVAASRASPTPSSRLLQHQHQAQLLQQLRPNGAPFYTLSDHFSCAEALIAAVKTITHKRHIGEAENDTSATMPKQNGRRRSTSPTSVETRASPIASPTYAAVAGSPSRRDKFAGSDAAQFISPLLLLPVSLTELIVRILSFVLDFVCPTHFVGWSQLQHLREKKFGGATKGASKRNNDGHQQDANTAQRSPKDSALRSRSSSNGSLGGRSGSSGNLESLTDQQNKVRVQGWNNHSTHTHTHNAVHAANTNNNAAGGGYNSSPAETTDALVTSQKVLSEYVTVIVTLIEILKRERFMWLDSLVQREDNASAVANDTLFANLNTTSDLTTFTDRLTSKIVRRVASGGASQPAPLITLQNVEDLLTRYIVVVQGTFAALEQNHSRFGSDRSIGGPNEGPITTLNPRPRAQSGGPQRSSTVGSAITDGANSITTQSKQFNAAAAARKQGSKARLVSEVLLHEYRCAVAGLLMSVAGTVHRVDTMLENFNEFQEWQRSKLSVERRQTAAAAFRSSLSIPYLGAVLRCYEVAIQQLTTAMMDRLTNNHHVMLKSLWVQQAPTIAVIPAAGLTYPSSSSNIAQQNADGGHTRPTLLPIIGKANVQTTNTLTNSGVSQNSPPTIGLLPQLIPLSSQDVPELLETPFILTRAQRSGLEKMIEKRGRTTKNEVDSSLYLAEEEVDISIISKSGVANESYSLVGLGSSPILRPGPATKSTPTLTSASSADETLSYVSASSPQRTATLGQIGIAAAETTNAIENYFSYLWTSLTKDPSIFEPKEDEGSDPLHFSSTSSSPPFFSPNHSKQRRGSSSIIHSRLRAGWQFSVKAQSDPAIGMGYRASSAPATSPIKRNKPSRSGSPNSSESRAESPNESDAPGARDGANSKLNTFRTHLKCISTALRQWDVFVEASGSVSVDPLPTAVPLSDRYISLTADQRNGVGGSEREPDVSKRPPSATLTASVGRVVLAPIHGSASVDNNSALSSPQEGRAQSAAVPKTMGHGSATNSLLSGWKSLSNTQSASIVGSPSTSAVSNAAQAKDQRQRLRALQMVPDPQSREGSLKGKRNSTAADNEASLAGVTSIPRPASAHQRDQRAYGTSVELEGQNVKRRIAKDTNENGTGLDVEGEDHMMNGSVADDRHRSSTLAPTNYIDEMHHDADHSPVSATDDLDQTTNSTKQMGSKRGSKNFEATDRSTAQTEAGMASLSSNPRRQKSFAEYNPDGDSDDYLFETPDDAQIMIANFARKYILGGKGQATNRRRVLRAALKRRKDINDSDDYSVLIDNEIEELTALKLYNIESGSDEAIYAHRMAVERQLAKEAEVQCREHAARQIQKWARTVVGSMYSNVTSSAYLATNSSLSPQQGTIKSPPPIPLAYGGTASTLSPTVMMSLSSNGNFANFPSGLCGCLGRTPCSLAALADAHGGGRGNRPQSALRRSGNEKTHQPIDNPLPKSKKDPMNTLLKLLFAPAAAPNTELQSRSGSFTSGHSQNKSVRFANGGESHTVSSGPSSVHQGTTQKVKQHLHLVREARHIRNSLLTLRKMKSSILAIERWWWTKRSSSVSYLGRLEIRIQDVTDYMSRARHLYPREYLLSLTSMFTKDDQIRKQHKTDACIELIQRCGRGLLVRSATKESSDYFCYCHLLMKPVSTPVPMIMSVNEAEQQQPLLSSSRPPVSPRAAAAPLHFGGEIQTPSSAPTPTAVSQKSHLLRVAQANQLQLLTKELRSHAETAQFLSATRTNISSQQTVFVLCRTRVPVAHQPKSSMTGLVDYYASPLSAHVESLCGPTFIQPRGPSTTWHRQLHGNNSMTVTHTFKEHAKEVGPQTKSQQPAAAGAVTGTPEFSRVTSEHATPVMASPPAHTVSGKEGATQQGLFPVALPTSLVSEHLISAHSKMPASAQNAHQWFAKIQEDRSHSPPNPSNSSPDSLRSPTIANVQMFASALYGSRSPNSATPSSTFTSEISVLTYPHNGTFLHEGGGPQDHLISHLRCHHYYQIFEAPSFIFFNAVAPSPHAVRVTTSLNHSAPSSSPSSKHQKPSLLGLQYYRRVKYATECASAAARKWKSFVLFRRQKRLIALRNSQLAHQDRMWCSVVKMQRVVRGYIARVRYYRIAQRDEILANASYKFSPQNLKLEAGITHAAVSAGSLQSVFIPSNLRNAARIIVNFIRQAQARERAQIAFVYKNITSKIVEDHEGDSFLSQAFEFLGNSITPTSSFFAGKLTWKSHFDETKLKKIISDIVSEFEVTVAEAKLQASKSADEPTTTADQRISLSSSLSSSGVQTRLFGQQYQFFTYELHPTQRTIASSCSPDRPDRRNESLQSPSITSPIDAAKTLSPSKKALPTYRIADSIPSLNCAQERDRRVLAAIKIQTGFVRGILAAKKLCKEMKEIRRRVLENRAAWDLANQRVEDDRTVGELFRDMKQKQRPLTDDTLALRVGPSMTSGNSASELLRPPLGHHRREISLPDSPTASGHHQHVLFSPQMTVPPKFNYPHQQRHGSTNLATTEMMRRHLQRIRRLDHQRAVPNLELVKLKISNYVNDDNNDIIDNHEDEEVIRGARKVAPVVPDTTLQTNHMESIGARKDAAPMESLVAIVSGDNQPSSSVVNGFQNLSTSSQPQLQQQQSSVSKLTAATLAATTGYVRARGAEDIRRLPTVDDISLLFPETLLEDLQQGKIQLERLTAGAGIAPIPAAPFDHSAIQAEIDNSLLSHDPNISELEDKLRKREEEVKASVAAEHRARHLQQYYTPPAVDSNDNVDAVANKNDDSDSEMSLGGSLNKSLNEQVALHEQQPALSDNNVTATTEDKAAQEPVEDSRPMLLRLTSHLATHCNPLLLYWLRMLLGDEGDRWANILRKQQKVHDHLDELRIEQLKIWRKMLRQRVVEARKVKRREERLKRAYRKEREQKERARERNKAEPSSFDVSIPLVNSPEDVSASKPKLPLTLKIYSGSTLELHTMGSVASESPRSSTQHTPLLKASDPAGTSAELLGSGVNLLSRYKDDDNIGTYGASSYDSPQMATSPAASDAKLLSSGTVPLGVSSTSSPGKSILKPSYDDQAVKRRASDVRKQQRVADRKAKQRASMIASLQNFPLLPKIERINLLPPLSPRNTELIMYHGAPMSYAMVEIHKNHQELERLMYNQPNGEEDDVDDDEDFVSADDENEALSSVSSDEDSNGNEHTIPSEVIDGDGELMEMPQTTSGNAPHYARPVSRLSNGSERGGNSSGRLNSAKSTTDDPQSASSMPMAHTLTERDRARGGSSVYDGSAIAGLGYEPVHRGKPLMQPQLSSGDRISSNDDVTVAPPSLPPAAPLTTIATDNDSSGNNQNVQSMNSFASHHHHRHTDHSPLSAEQLAEAISNAHRTVRPKSPLAEAAPSTHIPAAGIASASLSTIPQLTSPDSNATIQCQTNGTPNIALPIAPKLQTQVSGSTHPRPQSATARHKSLVSDQPSLPPPASPVDHNIRWDPLCAANDLNVVAVAVMGKAANLAEHFPVVDGIPVDDNGNNADCDEPTASGNGKLSVLSANVLSRVYRHFYKRQGASKKIWAKSRPTEHVDSSGSSSDDEDCGLKHPRTPKNAHKAEDSDDSSSEIDIVRVTDAKFDEEGQRLAHRLFMQVREDSKGGVPRSSAALGPPTRFCHLFRERRRANINERVQNRVQRVRKAKKNYLEASIHTLRRTNSMMTMTPTHGGSSNNLFSSPFQQPPHSNHTPTLHSLPLLQRQGTYRGSFFTTTAPVTAAATAALNVAHWYAEQRLKLQVASEALEVELQDLYNQRARMEGIARLYSDSPFPTPDTVWSNAAHLAKVFLECAAVQAWRNIFSHTSYDAYKQNILATTQDEKDDRMRRVLQRNLCLLGCYRADSEEKWLQEASVDISKAAEIYKPARSDEGERQAALLEQLQQLQSNGKGDERIEAKISELEVVVNAEETRRVESFYFTYDFVCQCFPVLKGDLSYLSDYLLSQGIQRRLVDVLSSGDLTYQSDDDHAETLTNRSLSKRPSAVTSPDEEICDEEVHAIKLLAAMTSPKVGPLPDDEDELDELDDLPSLGGGNLLQEYQVKQLEARSKEESSYKTKEGNSKRQPTENLKRKGDTFVKWLSLWCNIDLDSSSKTSESGECSSSEYSDASGTMRHTADDEIREKQMARVHRIQKISRAVTEILLIPPQQGKWSNRTVTTQHKTFSPENLRITALLPHPQQRRAARIPYEPEAVHPK